MAQRPLHFPTLSPGAACPTSPEESVEASFGIAQGNGPVYVISATEHSPARLGYADAQHFGGVRTDKDQGWGGQKVLWFANPNYQGQVLVRGQQLDGSHKMRFDGGLGDLSFTPQLVLDTTLGGSPWPSFPSFTRLEAPGCYAYQVDGKTFSYTIVFEAFVQN
ncbi:MAG TPA: hypothetical protein VGD98_14690 [Ktedonobacteraceae bacterium]